MAPLGPVIIALGGLHDEAENNSLPRTRRPLLGGCSGAAWVLLLWDTLEEARANIREAAEGWLDANNDRNPFEHAERGTELIEEVEL